MKPTKIFTVAVGPLQNELKRRGTYPALKSELLAQIIALAVGVLITRILPNVVVTGWLESQAPGR